MKKVEYSIRFITVIISVFILIAVGSYFYGVLLSNNYPKINTHDSLRDTVSQIFSDGRSSARITSTMNKKFSLPWAKRFENGQEISLTRDIKEGDVLLKKNFSDTIVLVQNKKRYIFVANKTIRED